MTLLDSADSRHATPYALQLSDAHKARQARFKAAAFKATLALPAAKEKVCAVSARMFDPYTVQYITGRSAVNLIAYTVGEALDVHPNDILGDIRYPYFQLGRWITVRIAARRLICNQTFIANSFHSMSAPTVSLTIAKVKHREDADPAFMDLIKRLDLRVVGSFIAQGVHGSEGLPVTVNYTRKAIIAGEGGR